MISISASHNLSYSTHIQAKRTFVLDRNVDNFVTSFSDDCEIISSGLYRYEYINGTTTQWATLVNNSITAMPNSSQSNQEIHRIERCTDGVR